MVMKNFKIVILSISALIIAFIAIIVLFTDMRLLMRRQLLDEDFTDVDMTIAVAHEYVIYRYMFYNDMKVVVSYGRRAYEGDTNDAKPMAFMASITEDIEITLDTEVYNWIMSLAEEIIEEGEGELIYGPDEIRLIIAKHDLFYETSYLPIIFESGKKSELIPLLRDVLPFDISESRRWKIWRGLPDSQERIDALTEG